MPLGAPEENVYPCRNKVQFPALIVRHTYKGTADIIFSDRTAKGIDLIMDIGWYGKAL